MSDEATPLPVATPPERGARGGVPAAAPEGDLGTFTRAFASGAKPVLLTNAKLIGGLAALALMSTLQHCAGKADTDKKVEEKAAEVSKEATETTKRAYRDLAKPTNATSAELTAALARITALEVATKAQSAVIAARERDFVVEGRPATARAKRVDKGLVDAVRANAAKNSKELAARAAKPLPVLKPIPLELPPAPSGGAGGATPPPQPQVRDAARSP
jgi:hypothetical protein